MLNDLASQVSIYSLYINIEILYFTTSVKNASKIFESKVSDEYDMFIGLHTLIVILSKMTIRSSKVILSNTYPH